MMNYFDIAGFEHVYLEDSFVLSIEESDDQVIFIVELVLTEGHPLFSKPRDDEQYCYRKGKIKFMSCRSINWHSRSNMQSVDKNDEVDLGNIDSFIKNSSKCSLAGDWGEIEIMSDSVTVELD